MHLSVPPSNGHFLGTHYIGFHWVYQLPAFRLQLFPLESLDVCCTCRLHLLLKTEVNICSAVLKHRKVYYTVMLSRTGKLPPKPQKRKLQYPLISMKSLASDQCQPESWFSLVYHFFLSVVCLHRAYSGVLMSSPYAYSCTSFLMLARMHPLE